MSFDYVFARFKCRYCALDSLKCLLHSITHLHTFFLFIFLIIYEWMCVVRIITAGAKTNKHGTLAIKIIKKDLYSFLLYKVLKANDQCNSRTEKKSKRSHPYTERTYFAFILPYCWMFLFEFYTLVSNETLSLPDSTVPNAKSINEYSYGGFFFLSVFVVLFRFLQFPKD